MRGGVRSGNSGAIYRYCRIGARYDDEISQGVNYLCWIQIKRVKQIYNNDTDTKKYRTVTIRATNLITYGDALFTTSIFSQSTPNLIYVGVIKVWQQQVMVRRGLG